VSKKKAKSRREEGLPASRPVVAGARPSDATCRLYSILSAFCCGAAVMVLELAGNRVLAPWFGNSLYTWTGLIGVILVSISGGCYLGGYLADRRPDYVFLAHLMGLAALLTLAVPLGQSLLEGLLDSTSVVWGPVLATLLLFAIPGCLLASVSPFAVRLVSLLSRDRHVGISAGSVGMVSTLGSVLGTFGAGFVLIPHVGLRSIFLVTGLLMGLLAAVGYWLFWTPLRARKGTAALAVVFFAGMVALVRLQGVTPPDVVFDQTTFYHRIRIREEPMPDGDRERTILLDTTAEGAQYVHSRRLPRRYQNYWELARIFCPRLQTAAFLGGGGFAMPEALVDAYPHARVEVIEIDPVVIDVGRRFFRLDQYPQIHAVTDDARRHLRMTEQKYDLVVADAFHGIRCIPGHLVTREFFQLVKDRLQDDGVVMVDIGAAVAGPDAVLFQSVLKTLGEVFEHHCVFSTRRDVDEQSIRNLFIVAAAHDLEPSLAAARNLPAGDTLHEVLGGYLPPGEYGTPLGVVFTDDWNPVEYLAAQTLKKRRPDGR
jgi:predicted membrane-bound spermidine synthase